MLWFNFILGLNFIFLCFKLIIIHYRTQKQRKMKFKPRTKLNHNIYIEKLNNVTLIFLICNRIQTDAKIAVVVLPLFLIGDKKCQKM